MRAVYVEHVGVTCAAVDRDQPSGETHQSVDCARVRPRAGWIDEVRAKKFQACFWRGSLTSSVDPDTLSTRLKCGAPANWSQFCDKDLDSLLDQGVQTLDPQKRHEIYKQALTLIQEKAYLASGISMPLRMGRRKELMGITYNQQMPNLDRAWLNK